MGPARSRFLVARGAVRNRSTAQYYAARLVALSWHLGCVGCVAGAHRLVRSHSPVVAGVSAIHRGPYARHPLRPCPWPGPERRESRRVHYGLPAVCVDAIQLCRSEVVSTRTLDCRADNGVRRPPDLYAIDLDWPRRRGLSSCRTSMSATLAIAGACHGRAGWTTDRLRRAAST